MKFLRYVADNREKNGILINGGVIEVGNSLIEAIHPFDIEDLEKNKVYALDEVKILPPVSPSKIICVGLNYRDHAEELKMELPGEPILFLKPPSSIIGHGDEIIYPPQSNQVDYEAELAVIISKKAKNVRIVDALDYVTGYTVLNDVTARDLQQRDGQWTRAKSFDTFCPLGPWMENDLDPSNLNISMRVNGELRQDSNTKNMIFPVEELLSFISNIMTLKPGDVIATGTPPGVGHLSVGDVVEASVEGIGVLKNKIEKIY
jgi:2-keto-4-pentenoate hydratase/2-oxohepta-3-ene-1,7-dioic acid hydratase in catechol pathway